MNSVMSEINSKGALTFPESMFKNVEESSTETVVLVELSTILLRLSL